MKYILLLLLFISCNTFGQSKCKFIGYKTYTETDYNKKTYCGSRHHRRIQYGERKITTASFYDLTLKRMFYLQKVESREIYCSMSGYFNIDWIHKGFKDNYWVEGKTYNFNLKAIEYTL